MEKKKIGPILTVGTAVILVLGIVRAATNHFVERRDALFKTCADDRARLGLSPEVVHDRYPTPELTFCRFARVVPGGAGEVVVRGKFQQGTKFVFDNDKVEVVKETLVARSATESEYRASITVGQSSGPDTARLFSFSPVRCMSTNCEAVYIGGKYEWDFSADNGWVIKLKTIDEPSSGERELTATYRAEFFKPGEAKPFEVRNIQVGVSGPGEYHGNIKEGAGAAALQQKMMAGMQNTSEAEQKDMEKRQKMAQAEFEKLQAKLQNLANLSEAEQKELIARLEQVAKEMAGAMLPKAAAESAQEMQKADRQFGCHIMNFWLKGNAVEGNMGCGEEVGKNGELNLKGTMKYLGP